MHVQQDMSDVWASDEHEHDDVLEDLLHTSEIQVNPQKGFARKSLKADDRPTLPANLKGVSRVWGAIRAEFYRKKSYVRFRNGDTWTLSISCTRGDHHTVCKQLFFIASARKNPTKQILKTERAKLEQMEAGAKAVFYAFYSGF